jgi:DNA polymerase III delta subunit
LQYLVKEQVNTIIFHTQKWAFHKAEGKKFFNVALFDIPSWFLRKIVCERFREYGVEENDVLIEKIIEEIYGKDLDLLYMQIDKLCLYLIDKKDPSMIDSDSIREAISGRENNFYDMLDNFVRFVITGEIENAVCVWNSLTDYMEPLSIIAFLIKKIRVFSGFYNLYGKNQFFDDFVDKYSSNTRKNFAQFNKDISELKKSLSDLLPVAGKSFLDDIKTSDNVSDFSYLCSVVRKDYVIRLFGNLIQFDGEFKTGLIKTPEDIFLLLMGEMKNEIA